MKKKWKFFRRKKQEESFEITYEDGFEFGQGGANGTVSYEKLIN